MENQTLNTQNCSTTKKHKIPCHYPWSSIYVSPNGDVKHCCATNLTKLGNLADQSIEEIWNGTLFQKIRSKVAQGDFDGAYCNPNCQGLRTNQGYPWIEKTKGDSIIEENEEKAIQNFENGIAKVDHLPTQLHLEFSDHCNFRCVMCFYEFKPPYRFIPDEAVNKLLDISDVSTHVSLMGGEVFMNKNDLRFIDDYKSPEGASIGFVTNASYLDDAMVEKIRKFKKMGMQISIDGTTKEVFEKVRKRGKWEVVDANIKRVVNKAVELRKEGYEWNIDLAFVVMASNLPNLAHSIKYAAKLDIPVNFHPVKGFHLFEENIFVYKNAIKLVGDWQTHINAAFEALESNKEDYNHYEAVKERLLDIEQFLKNRKIRIRKWVVKLLRVMVPKGDKKKSQGLSQQDRHVGHLIEIYYNLMTGKTSLKSTLSYLFMKVFKRSK